MLRSGPPLSSTCASAFPLTQSHSGARPDLDRLAVVTSHFNPCGYRRPRENYVRFREALRGVRLFTMEASFDGRFHLGADWEIRATEQNLMWQKEQMLNQMIQRLPPEIDRVAWIDADLLFQNSAWALETLARLEAVPVVQLFENCRYLNAQGTEILTHPSFARRLRDGLDNYGVPGGAWGARRNFLERHGLYASNIIGGGDQVFAHALCGLWHQYVDQLSPPALLEDYHRWQIGIWHEVRGQLGCVSGDVYHLYHGTRENRRYVERRQILIDARFDPGTDLSTDENGLLQWASDKPDLHQQVRDYFSSRNEDF